jgi:ribosome biogenesis ATPase
MTTARSSKCKLHSTRGDKGSTTKHSRVGGAKEHAPPAVCLADLGGVDPCVENMLEFVSMPLAHPKVYLHTNVQPSRGVLLHGLPGCGKTMPENAIGGGGGL